MEFLTECESSFNSAPKIFIESQISEYCYDSFLFKDVKPWVRTSRSLKRNLYKWKLKAKWVKYA